MRERKERAKGLNLNSTPPPQREMVSWRLIFRLFAICDKLKAKNLHMLKNGPKLTVSKVKLTERSIIYNENEKLAIF